MFDAPGDESLLDDAVFVSFAVPDREAGRAATAPGGRTRLDVLIEAVFEGMIGLLGTAEEDAATAFVLRDKPRTPVDASDEAVAVIGRRVEAALAGRELA